jgi:large subunit ribosomal protein L20
MANWNRKKVFNLAKGFKGKRKNCYGVAVRAVHRAAQFAYRDRKVKKRVMRREWISTINSAVKEHGLTYSKFAFALQKKSNIELDRKILATLAQTEPLSFKSVFDEVKLQSGVAEIMRRKPLVAQMTGVSYPEALTKGYIVENTLGSDLAKIIRTEPKADIVGLRFPERDAKTDADFMRLSYIEEDEAFLADEARKSLTVKE